MKAIVVREFGPPSVMRLEDVPDPQTAAGEVVVQVRAIGVNPVDTYLRGGRYRSLPSLPYTPGSDASGEVVAVGSGVTRWKVGDRVYTDNRVKGAYAELLSCPENRVHPLPGGIDFGGGAALGVPYATAHRALFARGGARRGERLLVHGATGGVGLAVVQLARAAGLDITATGGSEEGREAARLQGAHRVLDHHSSDHSERLVEAAGDGFDLILEMLANRNLATDLTVLARYGRVVVVGSRGTIEIDPRALMSRDLDVRGVLLANTPSDEFERLHQELRDGLASGELRPVIAAELPLEEAAAAHELVMEDGHNGKILLIP